MWFAMTMQSSCKDGSRHFHQIIITSPYLSHEYKKIIDLFIQRNLYFGHAENVILATITDHRLSYTRIRFAKSD